MEAIVVDDGSALPASVPDDERITLLRLSGHGGVAAARNAGARAARGRWIAYLDDNDELLPHFAETSLSALADTTLPAPVAALSGLEVCDGSGRCTQVHLPPTLSRGAHFGLETIDSRLSFFSKATLVVERSVLLGIGGFDESFGSMTYSELFLRLNPVCSIRGVPVVTYRQWLHDGPRISTDPARQRVNFERLLSKHRPLFEAHPRMFAYFLLDHGRILFANGHRATGLWQLARALRVHPSYVLERLARSGGRLIWRRTRSSLRPARRPPGP